MFKAPCIIALVHVAINVGGWWLQNGSSQAILSWPRSGFHLAATNSRCQRPWGYDRIQGALARKDFISLRMPCEDMQHPGTVGACQPVRTGIGWVMARFVASATCCSAEFFDPTGTQEAPGSGERGRPRRKGQLGKRSGNSPYFRGSKSFGNDVIRGQERSFQNLPVFSKGLTRRMDSLFVGTASRAVFRILLAR